ncbi:MAG: zinc-binding dehydrogenase [Clostridia bacterium]|nr:zinc-binding dehydrogenase [Clostridia bacterium]
MKVWKIAAPGALSMEEVTGELRPGHVKVKVTKLGLTGADVAVYEGSEKAKLPITPGRIATGFISEANEDSRFRKGERVLLSPYMKDAKGRLKIMGVDTDGYLADFVVVPEECVYSLPESITEDMGVFAEYVGIAAGLTDKLDLKHEQYVAILGANALGLIFAQLAIYYQAIPIIIDKSEKRLAAAEEFGIYYRIDSSKQDAARRIKQITCGKMADCTIFECRSSQQPQLAFSLTKEGGKVGIVGYDTFIGKLNADISAIMGRQLSVVGINNGASDMDAAINLLANEVVKVDDLVDKTVDFLGAPEAFTEAADSENNYLKIIIRC